MKIVFASNYYNHHQSTISEALDKQTGGNYRFVATSEMRQERRDLGYGMDAVPDYVLNAHCGERSQAEEAVESADAVIVGSAPEELVSPRIRAGKLTFRYTERLLKKKGGIKQWLKWWLLLHRRNPAGKPVYLLCAGGYVAADYAKFGMFKNRAYQWGYFPKTVVYPSVEELLNKKEKNEILWAGRLIDWKHPEHTIAVAKGLKAAGVDFRLNIIGSGVMENELRQQIKSEALEDCVCFLGSMKPEQVRVHMERAAIFLATSDRQEGWGAVINEAMNSGCAVVASHAMGSVATMITDGQNGLVYPSGNVDMLLEQVKTLLQDDKRRTAIGANAYESITNLWNAEVAAQRLCSLTERILSGEEAPILYENGPCSPAKIISDDYPEKNGEKL